MSEPWIDGAVTPPKVGQTIRYRLKSSVNAGSVAFVVGDNLGWVDQVHYYVLEETPREYVPPVEPMPELLPDLDGHAPRMVGMEEHPWFVESRGELDPNFILIYGSTKREVILNWNAAVTAIRAMKGEK